MTLSVTDTLPNTDLIVTRKSYDFFISSCDLVFDNRTHVDFVNDAETFQHARCSKGTHLSESRPCWKRKACGCRALPEGGAPE